MPHDLTLVNARIVLPDRVVQGALRCTEGRIDAILEGQTLAEAEDLTGDFLIPGLVDLHSDNLERQAQPRIAARWPSRSAYLAHDAQCAAAGITTVFDALCVGDLGHEQGRVQTYRDALIDGPALASLLRADHFLHLRCELPAPDMQALFALGMDRPDLRLVSLIDHTPGFGQYADLSVTRRLRQAEGMSADAIEALIVYQQGLRSRWRAENRAYLRAGLRSTVILASHDDRTDTDIMENRADGIAIAEFPVTLAAARAARSAGMSIVAGAPNLVRGGSHAGNVAVAALIAENLVDALASDYVPSSLIDSLLHIDDLPRAVARITATPAGLAGLADRGAVAPGLRADLVQLHLAARSDVAVVRKVWRAGCRIA